MIDFKDIDLLSVLPSNLLDAKTQALSEAMKDGLRQLQHYSRAAPLYAAVEELPDEALDLLAIDLRVQYYNPGSKRLSRENMVKCAVAWYLRGGTGSIVTEYLNTLYQGGRLDEWYTYGGKPYVFKAIVYLGLDDIADFGEGARITDQIKVYKNVRSWLEGLSFDIRAAFNASTQCKNILRLGYSFFPRFNLALLYLDNIWTLDDTLALSGYDSDVYLDFYPMQVHTQTSAGLHLGAVSYLVNKQYLNGSSYLNGGQLLDGGWKAL